MALVWLCTFPVYLQGPPADCGCHENSEWQHYSFFNHRSLYWVLFPASHNSNIQIAQIQQSTCYIHQDQLLCKKHWHLSVNTLSPTTQCLEKNCLWRIYNVFTQCNPRFHLTIQQGISLCLHVVCISLEMFIRSTSHMAGLLLRNQASAASNLVQFDYVTCSILIHSN